MDTYAELKSLRAEIERQKGEIERLDAVIVEQRKVAGLLSDALATQRERLDDFRTQLAAAREMLQKATGGMKGRTPTAAAEV